MKHHKLIALLWVVLFFSCTSNTKTAGGYTDETETVAGTAIQPHGLPIARIQIALHKDIFANSDSALLDSEKTFFTTTDSNGTFTFSAVPKGKWILSVNSGDTIGYSQAISVTSTKTTITMPAKTASELVALNIVRQGKDVISAFIVELGIDTAFGISDTLHLKVPCAFYTILQVKNSRTELVKSRGDTLTLHAPTPAILIWQVAGSWSFQDSSNPWIKSVNTPYANDAVVAAGNPIDSLGFLVLQGSAGLKISLTDSLKAAQFQAQARLLAKPGIDSTQNIFCSESSVVGSSSWCLRMRDQDSLVFTFTNNLGMKDSIVGTLPLDSLVTVTAEAYNGKASLWVGSSLQGSKIIASSFSNLMGEFAIGCRISQGTPDRFFNGLFDYITLSKN